jgi:hypothetical protein
VQVTESYNGFEEEGWWVVGSSRFQAAEEVVDNSLLSSPVVVVDIGTHHQAAVQLAAVDIAVEQCLGSCWHAFCSSF